uniref:Uncharacterized protein n=1 Tax=Rhizophora mucronata TaxID=61149 RepID=A0A2P2Q7Z8_RHIMU
MLVIAYLGFPLVTLVCFQNIYTPLITVSFSCLESNL